MATSVTAWKANNDELFETEQEALDYETYLIHKANRFSTTLLTLNQYLANYNVHDPITREVLQIIGLDSHSQFVNIAIISPDFINCVNLTPIRVNSLMNIANADKVYNLIIPFWAIEQQV